MMGRIFTPAEDREGASGTAILSYGLWQRAIRWRPRHLGRQILLNDERLYSDRRDAARAFFRTRDSELWTTFRPKPDAFVDRNDNWLERRRAIRVRA